MTAQEHVAATAAARKELTPRQTVAELDRYIVGQADAKRAVAIALRNRWRRKRVEPVLRDEIAPKNIIMVGATGVGKTEIARRLARLTGAPFIKVEASKFTEVGYVGRDVESIVRDLVEVAIKLEKEEAFAAVHERASRIVEDRLLDMLSRARAESTCCPARNLTTRAAKRSASCSAMATSTARSWSSRSPRRARH